jgi:hypothetical protein
MPEADDASASRRRTEQTTGEQTRKRRFANDTLHALVKGSACSEVAVEQHVTAEEE